MLQADVPLRIIIIIIIIMEIIELYKKLFVKEIKRLQLLNLTKNFYQVN